LDISNHKSFTQATELNISQHHAPEVIATAKGAIERLEKLLTLCDHQLDALKTKRGFSSLHQDLALIRLILRIRKDLDRYVAIAYLYSEFSPATVVVNSQDDFAVDANSTENSVSRVEKITTVTMKSSATSSNSPKPDLTFSCTQNNNLVEIWKYKTRKR